MCQLSSHNYPNEIRFVSFRSLSKYVVVACLKIFIGIFVVATAWIVCWLGNVMFGPGTGLTLIRKFCVFSAKQWWEVPMSPFAIIVELGTTKLFVDIRLHLVLLKINFVPMSHSGTFFVLPFILLSKVASQQCPGKGPLQMLLVCPHAPCDQQYLE